MSSDRRQHERLAIKLAVTLVSVKGDRVPGLLLDSSAGGVCVEANRSWGLDKRIKVEATPPWGGRVVVHGMIRRTHGYALHIEALRIDARSAAGQTVTGDA